MGYIPPRQPHREPGYAGEQGEAISVSGRDRRVQGSRASPAGVGRRGEGTQSVRSVPRDARAARSKLPRNQAGSPLTPAISVTHGLAARGRHGSVTPRPQPQAKEGVRRLFPEAQQRCPCHWPTARPVPVCPPDVGDVLTSRSLSLFIRAMAITCAKLLGRTRGRASSTRASPPPNPLTPCRRKDIQILPYAPRAPQSLRGHWQRPQAEILPSVSSSLGKARSGPWLCCPVSRCPGREKTPSDERFRVRTQHPH